MRCHSVDCGTASRIQSVMQSATEVFQPVTPRHDSRLRCGGQRDRHARARGQFQRGVVTVSLPCRLKILLTRFNESLYRNAGRGQHLARTHPIRHSTARFGNGLRRVRCQQLATAMSQRPLVGETSPWLGNVQRRHQKVRHMVANLHSAQHSLFRRANRGLGFQ